MMQLPEMGRCILFFVRMCTFPIWHNINLYTAQLNKNSRKQGRFGVVIRKIEVKKPKNSFFFIFYSFSMQLCSLLWFFCHSQSTTKLVSNYNIVNYSYCIEFFFDFSQCSKSGFLCSKSEFLCSKCEFLCSTLHVLV